MTSIQQNKAGNPPRGHDGAKQVINMNQMMAQKANELYRNSPKLISSDSEANSLQDSTSTDSDYQFSLQDLPQDRYPHRSRDEIAEKLSMLKIGYNKDNCKNDSGTVRDITSEDDLRPHSILAGKSPADKYHTSIHSIAESRYSTILAGRLDSIDASDERSLLNIAINESVEANGKNRSCNAETSRYVDSLEAQKEEIPLYAVDERDSLETGARCAENKSRNTKAGDSLFNNDENVDPNSLKSKSRGRPRIISNETANFSIQKFKRPAMKASANQEFVSYDSVSKDRNDNIERNSSSFDSIDNKFQSSVSESERLVIADVKTPNMKAILFIEDCCKSSPKVGVNADTFGSEFITDISNLSALGDGSNVEPNYCREKIFKRFSQRFAAAPIKFTEMLLTLFEESIQLSSKPENPDISGVSLNRLTEEFRKICSDYGKRIEDESMPDFGFGLSFNASVTFEKHTSKGVNAAAEETTTSSLQNFSKLGGGKKVYRKTPRRIYQTNNGTHCSTPNCANALHKMRKNNLDSPDSFTPNVVLDNTETFEFWENLCYEMSPTKPPRAKSPIVETSGLLTREDLIRKSDQLMASLDKSIRENYGEAKYDSCERNLSTTSEDCQDDCNLKKQKFIEKSSLLLANCNDKSNEEVADPNNIQNHNEIEEILTAHIVKKRRKCFEEARKVFETKQSAPRNKYNKSVDKMSEYLEENESLGKRDDEVRFLSTLSACMDYFDHVKTLQKHRNSLHCILECSEDSESLKESRENTCPIEFVEAVILPAQNRAKYKLENPEILLTQPTPNKPKLIAQTSLYLPGTPKTSNAKFLAKSPRRIHSRSPSRSVSPEVRSSSVVAKKIKSPVSPRRRRNVHAIKPASHANIIKAASVSPRGRGSENKQKPSSDGSSVNFTSRFPSNDKMKSASNSPGLMDVTNIRKSTEMPKIIVTNSSPASNSWKRSNRLEIHGENPGVNCQRELQFSDVDSPEVKTKKFFYTPEKTPTPRKVKPKKKYFQTPKGTPFENKLPATSPGSYRVNYNSIQSPVRMYIKGTDPNLIKNVKGKTNERMLTPRTRTPNTKSKVASPILAGSPGLSPISTETSRLKFLLTPLRRQREKHQSNVLNIALCESDPSSNIGSESSSNSPFPKIFYKPAPCVKMVKENPQQSRRPKILMRGTEEKIIYRHEGRLKSATASREPNLSADESMKDSLSYDSRDVSLMHQRPATRTNYLLKK